MFCFDCHSETVELAEKLLDGSEVWRCTSCRRTWPVKLGGKGGEDGAVKGIDPLRQLSSPPPKIYRSKVEDTVVPEAM